MTTGDNEWRMKRIEEILSKTVGWDVWHSKQLTAALAEAGVSVLGSMSKSKTEANKFVRSIEGSIDYGLSREEFEKQVETQKARFLWNITPRNGK